MTSQVFGPPAAWPGQDLIGLSKVFGPGLVLAGYTEGVFPMPMGEGAIDGEMAWWSPMERGVIDPGGLRITRSLCKSARHYTTTIDRAFGQVIAHCADPARSGGWINEVIREVYTQLHLDGHVHSVETWDGDGRLVGGLYGVSIRGLFAGESMFHDPERGRDASKVALVRLAGELARQPGSRVLDVQWMTGHLASLGAYAISREDYLTRLARAMDQPTPVWSGERRPGDWGVNRQPRGN